VATATSGGRNSSSERAAWLERVLVTYGRGLLVPFIGAGMSVNVCRLWDGFIAELEQQAVVPSARAETDPAQRAARAVRKLRRGSGDGVADAVSAALLSNGPGRPPPQSEALASVFWPLVVTTNYDDLYLAAAHAAHLRLNERLSSEEKRNSPLLLLGRSREDSQRILTSLRQPDVPILWALQGFVGGQAQALQSEQHVGSTPGLYRENATIDDDLRHLRGLRKELVVGHAEYRRVAIASEPFRRAFAELYRSRSLLFLGAGLKDRYFLDLFNEIIELYGPSPHAHYGVLQKGASDVDFLQQYFGIWVCEIDNSDLPRLLTTLAGRISGSRPRQTIWQFGQTSAEDSDEAGKGASELRIVRGRLPAAAEGRCVVFSGGGRSGKFRLSQVSRGILQENNLPGDPSAFELVPGHGKRILPLWQHRDNDRFLAVSARLSPSTEDGRRLRPTIPAGRQPNGEPAIASARMERDIRLVSIAIREVMQVAQAREYDEVDAMLLAAGPLRTFPEAHALMQMVRGWSTWRNAGTGSMPSLSIHLVARGVLYDLDSGLLDVSRHLTPNVVEFWLEIEREKGEVERYLQVVDTGSAIQGIFTNFDIAGPNWALNLVPHPCLGWGRWNLADINKWEQQFGALSMETFGILPGSILSASWAEPIGGQVERGNVARYHFSG
jgi:hypothetical protein